MPAKTKEEKLFGAACVYVTLERSGMSPEANELYLSTLAELQLPPEDVERYLGTERMAVEKALARHGQTPG